MFFGANAFALSCRSPSIPLVLNCSAAKCDIAFAVKKNLRREMCSRSPSGFYESSELDFTPLLAEFAQSGITNGLNGAVELALAGLCVDYLQLKEFRDANSRAEMLKNCLTKTKISSQSNETSDLHLKWQINIWLNTLLEPAILIFLLLILEWIYRSLKKIAFGNVKVIAGIILGLVPISILYYIAVWAPQRWLILPVIFILYGIRILRFKPA
jgi:hypothetical protein